IFGNGENARDFTSVTDTARGIALAAAADSTIGEVVNLAFGTMISVREIAQIVVSLCDQPNLEPVYAAPRPGDGRILQADTTRARMLLGFAAETDVHTGLKTYLEWFRAQHADPAALLEPEIRNWEMPDARSFERAAV